MKFLKKRWLDLLVIILAFLNVGQQWLYGSHSLAYTWLAIGVFWMILIFILKDDNKPKKK
ncbi:hypothetical protein ACVR0S_00215 [Streptococcus dentapri]|uniref:Uncharacterized protein n=1 Tax=Streptococcus dentapri TaxID=573564 RepID=A0ABV8D1F4_9STRE